MVFQTMIFRKLVPIVGILAGSGSVTVAQEAPEVRLAHQEAALRVIRETAASLCAEVKHGGEVTHTEAVAKAQIGLNGLFKRLMDIGASGEVKTGKESYIGPAQRDLPAALQSGYKCNYDVLVILQPILLPPPPPPALPPFPTPLPSPRDDRTNGTKQGADKLQPASDSVILRVFPKNNVTQRDVQVLKAALPSYNVLLGQSAIDPRNPADVLFVNRDRVGVEAVVEAMAALQRIGVQIKSVQQSKISGRREIQVGTIVEGSDGEGVFRNNKPLDLSRLRTLKGVAFWKEAFNGQPHCPAGNGYLHECRMTADARPIE